MRNNNTDGFVVGYSAGSQDVKGYTDGSTPPTTVRGWETSTGGRTSITIPVREGDYWKIDSASTIFWIPFGLFA